MSSDVQRLQAFIEAQRRAAAAGLDPDAVQQTVAEQALLLTGAEGAVVEVVDGDETVCRAVCGSAERFGGMRVKLESSLSGHCVRLGEVQRCDDATIDDRVDREACRLVGVRSMLVAPLVYEGRVLGVLKVVSPKPAAFSEADAATLESLAEVITAFLCHARKFEEKERLLVARTEALARVEAQLRAAHGELEGRVEERTRALAAANAALEAEVAERRRVEQALERTRDAALEATQLKSAFLATMSHEIRTPMNAVIGMTSLLRDTALSPEQREFVEAVRSAGDSLLAIINDILDFSKIESGRVDVERAEFVLRDCVEEALDLFAPAAAAKGLDLVCDIDASAPEVVAGDATRLRQILVNLVGNATKFTEAGEIVASVRAADGSGGLELEFAVSDTGVGIPSDRLDRVFESFTQADSSTTRRYGGTGLGLTISKRLAELMGGRMWAESVEGAGSTFRFTIAAERAGPRASGPLVAPQGLAGRVALVVDDNASSLRVLAGLLATFGLRVETAAGATEALDLVERGLRFDIAVVDLEMPGRDGVNLAAALRCGPSGAAPLVLLAPAARRRERRVAGAGFFAVLAKPAKATAIRAAVSKALGCGAGAPEGGLDLTASGSFPAVRELRILLAEDVAVNQKVALKMLERLGHRADVAANGVEVLRALERQRYEVVLMDIQMPEMDGLEATRQIRARWGASGPHVIAMTANAMQGDRERCLEAGMDGYVSKPVRPEDLARALMRAAAGV